jgi:hypothetical protein
MIESKCERPGCTNTIYILEGHVGKKKQYCSANCRQIVHRLEKERKEREVRQLRLTKLQHTLKLFSPEVQAKLEEIIGYSESSIAANLLKAEIATEALLLQRDEMKALARAKYTEGYEEGKKEAAQA